MQPNYETQINKLVNLIMKRGKKNVAQTLLFDALFLMRIKTKKNPIYLLRRALANTLPVVTVKATKRGSKWYKIPTPLKEGRAIYLSAMWIVKGANKRTSAHTSLSININNINKSKSKKSFNIIRKVRKFPKKILENKYGFSRKLCEELIANASNTGEAVKSKTELYADVIENRPYMRNN